MKSAKPGKKLLVVNVDPDIHLKLKVLSVMSGTSMAKILKDLVTQHVISAGSVPVDRQQVIS